MTYTTWILIGIGWLVGSFVLSLGIVLIFDPEDNRWEGDYLSEDEGLIDHVKLIERFKRGDE